MTRPAKLTAYISVHDNSLVIERTTPTKREVIKTAIALEKNLLGRIFPCYPGPTDHSFRVRLMGTFQIVVDTRAATIVITQPGSKVGAEL